MNQSIFSESEKNLAYKILSLFKIDGEPADKKITAGQLEIFLSIILRKKNRLQIIAASQYGKSLIVAFALIVLACVENELVAVLAPSAEKAKIIMRYFIAHLADHPLFYSQLEKETRVEKLLMEATKDRIVLKNKGGVFILSVDAKNSKSGFQAAMGEGARIVIQDESALIPDATEATIFRMIAGKKNAFYVKIGNPFFKNHFKKSWDDENYQKIFIDYHQGIAEGRFSNEFIDEAKKKPFFDVLFECKFKDADMLKDEGYFSLFKENNILDRKVLPFGEKRLGVDVAEGGGNYNVIVLRHANTAKVLLKYQSPNTMDLAGKIIMFATTYGVLDENIFIDGTGVGKGVVDRLREQRWNVNEVKWASKAKDFVQFANKRAEDYWRLSKWVFEGGSLEGEWGGLVDIKYKTVESNGKVQIMKKEEMRKRGIDSPDEADALALTFSREGVIDPDRKRKLEDRGLLKQFDFYNKGRNNKSNGYFTGSAYLRGLR